MARTLLDYMPVSKRNITKFLSNNHQNLSSYRILELVKNIPNEDDKLNAFVKYYDEISHGSFEKSYIDIFTYDYKFKLISNLSNKIFDKNIYLKLNEFLKYFDNIEDKYKLIDSLKERFSHMDDIDIKLILSEIEENSIKVRIINILNMSPSNKYIYYCNYIDNESSQEKFNNINRFGLIYLNNLDIVKFIKELNADDLKIMIIKKYYDENKDIDLMEITRLSMEFIKYIKDEEIKNDIVNLVKEKIYVNNVLIVNQP